MPPNDRPNVPCANDGAAILPLEGAVNDLIPVVVFCLNVPFREGAVNDLLPVVCRVKEPLREAVIVLLLAKVEPLVLGLVEPVQFFANVVDMPLLLLIALRFTIDAALLWTLGVDHRELLSVKIPPVALCAGSIREKLPVCESRKWLLKCPSW